MRDAVFTIAECLAIRLLFAATHDHRDRLETRLENTVGDEGVPDVFRYDERYSNRGGPFFVGIL